MVFLNFAVVDAARVVARQTAETAVTAIVQATDAASSAAVTSPPATILSSAAASPTTTESSTLANGSGSNGGSSNNNNNSGGNSNSLLFFVALGFGVVFTNLWIIVGVKYCFRYNARNRQLRNEDGEPINMENMPRPHRRRREKKLMPIDEVNEKFPMVKYKTWVSSRAQEGLPTRGGVTAPTSRPNSIRDADGIAQDLAPKERMSTDERPTTSAAPVTTPTKPESETASKAVPQSEEKPEVHSPQHAPKESTSSTVGGAPRASVESHRDAEGAMAQKHMSQISHDDEEEDEHIDAALPPECMGTSGDTCAICIDTLEDDDDVRGLTCGHAFHAACIDPWLTTRRACCPLCKTDYYTPKPRPPPPEGAADGTTGVVQVNLSSNSRSNDRINLPSRPRQALFIFGRIDQTNQRADGRSRMRDARGQQQPRTSPSPPAPASPAEAPSGGGNFFSGLRNAWPGFRVARTQSNEAGSDAAAAATTTTPSQLEAGVARNSQR
ncbi:hypothetical protein C8A05DRAFT_43988 [Staphylotrichum tortipilum]|uniref:RING-type domain-containing protein n=1 Tax=Staphylotrichum tortipilum TaxID=2831512 RepID=A0AAN6MKJ4_9PEZI|nr:hypothetical protein C8A05DRAFT_43988 [Staphylotrichum longicolle]